MFAHVQQAEQNCDAALDTPFAKPTVSLGSCARAVKCRHMAFKSPKLYGGEERGNKKTPASVCFLPSV